MLWVLCISNLSAQTPRVVGGTIDAGTTINVRTNETINAQTSDGRVFTGVVAEDVLNRNGALAIPRGADVELVVKSISVDELALDMDAVIINNQRYGLVTEGIDVDAEREGGVGANARTGKYVGGGALLGAVIGAIAGGGKGAAIGAGAGAAAGAGVQILTRGRIVNVPAESLLSFRLEQPLRTPVLDNGFDLDGRHYHPGGGDSADHTVAYREGFRAGRSDADRNLPRNTKSTRWQNAQDRREYEAGYDQGYVSEGDRRNQPAIGIGNRDALISSRPGVRIGPDNYISWQAPESVQVYVQVDNDAPKLFAQGRAGSQAAPWIASGHLYSFVVKDARGRELARDELDLRRPAERSR
jgi:hypothetical protein